MGIKIVDGHYEPSEEASIVKEIFKTYISTRSIKQTARRFGRTANGTRYLLKNETYLKTGIIDRETWDTAQGILKTRGQRSVRTDRVYLFSGLIICPHCGGHLTCSRIGERTYYRCPRHYDGNCPGIHIPEEKVEKYLLSWLVPQIEEYNVTVRSKRKTVDISALKRKQDKLTDLYLNDLINRDKYESDFRELQTQIEEAEKEKKPIDTHQVRSLLDSYAEWSPKARKAFWSTLIASIVPEDDDHFTVNYT